MQDRLNWQDVRVLLAFGRHGSLTQAALALGVDETTAARNLKRLEAALGVTLLSRDGSKIRLTDAGSLAYERAKVMEAAAISLAGTSPDQATDVTGEVAITSLLMILSQVLIPAMPGLVRAHPGITTKLLSGNANLSLARGDADIAIRLGSAVGEGETAVSIGQFGYAVYRPRNRFANLPLARCPWVAVDDVFMQIPDARWVTENISPSQIIMRANTMTCMVAAVKAGMACALLPVVWGDNDPDMVRIQEPVMVKREAWLLTRADQDPDSAVGHASRWIIQLFADLRSALEG